MLAASNELNITTSNAANSLGCKYLFWKVSSRQYAIPLAQVREILSLPIVTNLPEFHPTLHSVFNLRGKIISLSDVRSKLGQQSGVLHNKRPYVIALDFKDLEIGIVVDDIIEVAYVQQSDIEENIDAQHIGCEREYIKGVIHHTNGNLTILLQINKLLGI